MTRLRNRIVLLLVAAIITVVGLATFAASRALGPPPMNGRLEAQATQLRLVAALVERDRPAAVAQGASISDHPAIGDIDRHMTDELSDVLARSGSPLKVLISRHPESRATTASVELSDGLWLVMAWMEQGPPPGGWITLAIWAALIVIGSAAVSIFAASKIVRPLELIESAVARIGPDGALPTIPETGPGEIRATAHALNRMSARLKSAIESRMRLVAAAGHDLRTPMTRMRLRAEFIVDDGERDKWLADLNELDAIADSAMMLVREEVKVVDARPVRLDQLIGQVAAELHSLGYAVTLAQVDTAFVSGSPLALTRAIRNLVINAATHGERAMMSCVTRADDVVVTIVDEGPGIPQVLLGQVFEPFFRVDGGRRKSIAGAGLGLAIAKEIIERFGGRITLANRVPRGLLQEVVLPRAVMDTAPTEVDQLADQD
ncbi:ATP-binding protein [Neorhizobium sp. NCHU2750]|uniref:ATP-binding protein n=1 Tax=Neorhizobium sp. NCHU2750 TaxID=1825976 RepID=UPI000E756E5A|nr:sensor histidine kinase [Neorhizobium sp. NCHU2750]